jgi:type I restriction enzyme S subunit
VRAGWQQTTLGEIVSFKGGGTPSTESPSYWNGDIPWVSPKDMKSSEVGDSIDKITPEAIENSAASLIPKDAILIVVRSGILARTIPVGITVRSLAVNQDIKALCPNKDIDPRYLHYFMLMSEPNILKLVTRGATVHRLSTDSLKALTFLKPPFAEQQRIVAILDEAFAGLATATANTEKNLKNARELFESYRESIFETKGDDWRECRLSQLVEIKHGFAFKSEYFTSDGDYILLTPGNFFEEGGYRDRGDKQKYYVGEIPDGFILNKGDFLIAMTEQAAGLLGSSIIVPENDKFLHNQRLGLVRLKPGTEWSNEFFFHAFNTRRFRDEAHDSASGVKVRHTSPTKLGDILISFPNSCEQQNKVAKKLDDLLNETKRLDEKYELKLSQISELKQSILQRAFSGELTSPPSQAIKEAAE